MSLEGTGLNFEGTSAGEFGARVQALRSRGTKVMISVGGASTPDNTVSWNSFNAAAAAAFVQDFGLDGIDIDFQPDKPGERGPRLWIVIAMFSWHLRAQNGGSCLVHQAWMARLENRCPAWRGARSSQCLNRSCSQPPLHAPCGVSPTTGLMTCAVDEQFQNIVLQYRSSLAATGCKLLAAALWSSGAWGQAPYENLGVGSPQTGLSINMLKAVGSNLDFINVLSYNGGPDFNYTAAYQAYKSFFPGIVLLGMQVAPEYDGTALQISGVNALSSTVRGLGGAGLFLFSFSKGAVGGASATDISQAVCRNFQLGDCTASIPRSTVQ
uniref:Uncharacterized protein n=1 Tax=Auxenochlorella protothecoides TaxID=3075 RepID=A0A1D2AAE4_AUXPR